MTNRTPRPFAFAIFTSLASLAVLPVAPARGADSPAVMPDATATSAVAALHIPRVVQSRLENGLTVILEENHQAPFVAMQLQYDAGSRDDPPGKEGLASLTERMTRQRTKHVPAGGYDATLDRIGATDRGWETALDTTSERATVPSNAIDTVLWLWSDQMGFFSPEDPKNLDEARSAKGRDREEKVVQAPLGTLNEIVLRALYPEGHPYHSAPGAALSDGATLEDARSFHDANLAPNNAVLALVGDFQAASVLERVKAYFAPIAAAPARSPAKLAPAQLEREARLDVAANVSAAEVWMDWRTPPFFAGGDADLDVGARAMVGLRVAALRWSLVETLQTATRVYARQISHALGSDFRITATVAPGHTPDEVIAGIDAVLEIVRTRGLKEEAFAGARANMTVPFIHGLDRGARRAFIYAELALAHRDPTRILGDVGRYDAITARSVNAAMAHWLTPGNRVVTVVTPDHGAPPGGVLRAARGGK